MALRWSRAQAKWLRIQQHSDKCLTDARRPDSQRGSLKMETQARPQIFGKIIETGSDFLSCLLSATHHYWTVEKERLKDISGGVAAY